MQFAKKTDVLKTNIFLQLGQTMDQARAAGKEIINLSVGTPDLPPPSFVLEVLSREVLNPENMKYALSDLPELLRAARDWYLRRYGVTLEPGEVCSLMGSQDGLAHLPMVLLDPGDICLVPDPGYPIFSGGPLMASAQLYRMPLREETGYLPDLNAIPPSVAHAAKMMTLSYPMNPLCKMAPDSFFEEVIAFAKKYDIVLLHDNAYSELTYDGVRGGSFLRFPGAKEVGVEFNSLSKSHNLTGARISFALGNRDVVQALSEFKSNVDYGIFRPIQKAAIAALDGPQDCVAANRAAYQSRRDALVSGLKEAGWPITPPEATMFAWAKLPEGMTDSFDFCTRCILECGVAMVPGVSFGPGGEGYVRMALVQPEEQLRLAAKRIGTFLGGR